MVEGNTKLQIDIWLTASPLGFIRFILLLFVVRALRFVVLVALVISILFISFDSPVFGVTPFPESSGWNITMYI